MENIWTAVSELFSFLFKNRKEFKKLNVFKKKRLIVSLILFWPIIMFSITYLYLQTSSETKNPLGHDPYLYFSPNEQITDVNISDNINCIERKLSKENIPESILKKIERYAIQRRFYILGLHFEVEEHFNCLVPTYEILLFDPIDSIFLEVDYSQVSIFNRIVYYQLDEIEKLVSLDQLHEQFPNIALQIKGDAERYNWTIKKIEISSRKTSLSKYNVSKPSSDNVVIEIKIQLSEDKILEYEYIVPA